jgi:hypothetical protein
MRRILVICAKFTAAVLVTLVCFEIYFRTTEISLPSFVMDDPVLGRAFRPNARAALVQEGFYMGRINENGGLGPGYPPERTEGTLRVALVGDSFVEAFQVFPEWNARSVLERELSERTGRRVEVMNFGLSGHTLRTMYAYNQDLVARFQPDVTLFVVVGSSFLARDKEKGPVCYLDEEGSLKVSYAFAESKTYERKMRLGFTRDLGSFQMLQSALMRYRQGLSLRIFLGKFALRRRAGNELPKSRATDRYFDLNKAVLDELGRLDRSGGSRIIIVGHKDVPPYYMPIIEEAGLTYFDLRRELDELERSGIDPYRWPVTGLEGHWNHEGHRRVGEYLAKRLLEWDVLEGGGRTDP